MIEERREREVDRRETRAGPWFAGERNERGKREMRDRETRESCRFPVIDCWSIGCNWIREE